jgi:hypothetical protein
LSLSLLKEFCELHHISAGEILLTTTLNRVKDLRIEEGKRQLFPPARSSYSHQQEAVIPTSKKQLFPPAVPHLAILLSHNYVLKKLS